MWFIGYSFVLKYKKANRPWISLFWLYNVAAFIIVWLRGIMSITVNENINKN